MRSESGVDSIEEAVVGLADVDEGVVEDAGVGTVGELRANGSLVCLRCSFLQVEWDGWRGS